MRYSYVELWSYQIVSLLIFDILFLVLKIPTFSYLKVYSQWIWGEGENTGVSWVWFHIDCKHWLLSCLVLFSFHPLSGGSLSLWFRPRQKTLTHRQIDHRLQKYLNQYAPPWVFCIFDHRPGLSLPFVATHH